MLCASRSGTSYKSAVGDRTTTVPMAIPGEAGAPLMTISCLILLLFVLSDSNTSSAASACDKTDANCADMVTMKASSDSSNLRLADCCTTSTPKMRFW